MKTLWSLDLIETSFWNRNQFLSQFAGGVDQWVKLLLLLLLLLCVRYHCVELRERREDMRAKGKRYISAVGPTPKCQYSGNKFKWSFE